jgi:hypothetical protein
LTTPEEVQEVKVVDWSLRNLGINVSLRQLFFDEHGNCDQLYPPGGRENAALYAAGGQTKNALAGTSTLV